MEKVKRVSSSVDATSIDPPCAFAISLTMKSPRPRPCWLRRTAPLKKGWNSCARAAGGIGTPPLATDRTNLPPTVCASTSIGTPGAPCVTALAIRFEASCPILPGSQSTGCSIEKWVMIWRSGAIARISADDLLEDRREGLRGIAGEDEPVAEPATREVEDIVDQRCRAGDACVHLLHDELAPATQRLPLADHLNAGRQRGKRVSEVVPEHGYELLAQHRSLVFGGGRRLGLRPGGDKAALIGASVHRLEHREASEEVLLVRPALFGGVGDHRQLAAVRVQQIQREFVHETLQAQQRRHVRLIRNPPAEAQQGVERPPEQRVAGRAEPVGQRSVHLHDAGVRRQ